MFKVKKPLLDEIIEEEESKLRELDPYTHSHTVVSRQLTTLYRIKRDREAAKEREIRDRAKKLGNLAERIFERIFMMTYKAFRPVRNIRF